MTHTCVIYAGVRHRAKTVDLRSSMTLLASICHPKWDKSQSFAALGRLRDMALRPDPIGQLSVCDDLETAPNFDQST